MLSSLPVFAPYQTTSISVLSLNHKRHLEEWKFNISEKSSEVVMHKRLWIWRIHYLLFPSLFHLCPTTGCPSLTVNAFQWETVARFFPHPLVLGVCSVALELVANQSQRLSYTNKQDLHCGLPRVRAQQPNKQLSQVIAGWTNRQDISQTLSCLYSPSSLLSTGWLKDQARQTNIWDNNGEWNNIQ